MPRPICVSCHKPYIKNPRQKKQRYCSAPDCQKTRKAEWQRKKMKADPEYKLDQKKADEQWRKTSPGYWKNYREKHPDRKLRNKLLQRKRNQKRRIKGSTGGKSISDPKMIAKMDVLKGYLSVNNNVLRPP